MTRAEAIEWLEYHIATADYDDGDDLLKALKYAVKKLKAEPIVRCKDCKYRNGDYCHCYNGFAYGGNFFFVRPDDFCSSGEKEEVEE